MWPGGYRVPRKSFPQKEPRLKCQVCVSGDFSGLSCVSPEYRNARAAVLQTQPHAFQAKLLTRNTSMTAWLHRV